MTFEGKTDSLEVFTDSSFRDCSDSLSTSGMIIKLYDDPIAWRSHKQSCVAISVCHAEYYAMSEACQEIISLDKAIRDILGKSMYPVSLRYDNKYAARDCTEKEGNHKLKNFDDSLDEINRKLGIREKTGTKSLMGDTHGDYIKQCVIEGTVKVKWISSKEKQADIFTKPLPHESFTCLRNKLMNIK